MTIKITTRPNGKRRVTIEGFEKTRTQQNQIQQCDMKNIISRYKRTGQLPLVANNPIYGDYSNVDDFKTSVDTIMKAQEQFYNLPSKLRSKLDNSPEKFLEYMADTKNKDEWYEYGLAKKPTAVIPDNEKPKEVKE